MSNQKWKLPNSDYWATDGIYDFDQSDTQRNINADLKSAITSEATARASADTALQSAITQNQAFTIYVPITATGTTTYTSSSTSITGYAGIANCTSDFHLVAYQFVSGSTYTGDILADLTVVTGTDSVAVTVDTLYSSGYVYLTFEYAP